MLIVIMVFEVGVCSVVLMVLFGRVMVWFLSMVWLIFM